MSKYLTVSYNSSLSICLEDIAEEHEFDVNDIESLYVKYSELNITLKDGREIEHSIEHSLDLVEVDDFKRPSFMSITNTDDDAHTHTTVAESNNGHLSLVSPRAT